MKNLLWLLLGAAIGAMITFKYLEFNASDGFLEKLITKRTSKSLAANGGPITADKTDTISVSIARGIISQYKQTLPYRLKMIANNKGDAIESWVIDLRKVDSLYRGIDIQGLRVYLAKNKAGADYTTLVVTGAKEVVESDTIRWTNVFGSGNKVLQYVLPCPDNCNTVVATDLGGEGRK